VGKSIVLTPRERYLITVGDVNYDGSKGTHLTAKTEYIGERANGRYYKDVPRTSSDSRKLLEYRLQHKKYCAVKEFAKMARGKTFLRALELRQFMDTWGRSFAGYFEEQLLALADAELDVEGKTDEEIEKMLFVEKL
jgi:hypothetical protein